MMRQEHYVGRRGRKSDHDERRDLLGGRDQSRRGAGYDWGEHVAWRRDRQRPGVVWSHRSRWRAGWLAAHYGPITRFP